MLCSGHERMVSYYDRRQDPPQAVRACHGQEDVNLLRRLRTSTAIALILSPTGLLLIAVTRLLIISNYNQVTALAIVSSGGYVNSLLGTIIPLTPIFMPYIALAFLFFRRVIPGILAFTAAALISPTKASRTAALHLLRSDFGSVYRWGTSHAVIVLPVTIVTVGLLLLTMSLGFNMFTRTLGTIVSLALIPSIVYLYPLPYKNSYYSQQLRQPWLPAETITMTSGQKVTGYVLSSDSDWLEVLREDTRRIIHYRASTVAGQQICQIGGTRALRPLVTLTSAVTEAPQCMQSRPGNSDHVACPPKLLRIPPQARPPLLPVYRSFARCT
jgi:hypothetical protein